MGAGIFALVEQYPNSTFFIDLKILGGGARKLSKMFEKQNFENVQTVFKVVKIHKFSLKIGSKTLC